MLFRQQEATRLFVDGPIAGGDNSAPICGVLAIPCCDNAASALDDRRERHDIMGFEVGLDHEVDKTGGERAIGVTIATIAREPEFLLHPSVGRPIGLLNQLGLVVVSVALLSEAQGRVCRLRVTRSVGGASPREGASVRNFARLPSP